MSTTPITKANQTIGTCPVCHDVKMAFEATDATHLECGGCGSVSTVAAVNAATSETNGEVNAV